MKRKSSRTQRVTVGEIHAIVTPAHVCRLSAVMKYATADEGVFKVTATVRVAGSVTKT